MSPWSVPPLDELLSVPGPARSNLEVRWTHDKGLGVFATQDLKPCDRLRPPCLYQGKTLLHRAQVYIVTINVVVHPPAPWPSSTHASARALTSVYTYVRVI